MASMSRVALGLLLFCLAAGAQSTGPLDPNRKPRLPRVDEPLPKRPTDRGSVGQRPPNEVIVIEDEPTDASSGGPEAAPGPELADPGPPVLRRSRAGSSADEERRPDRPFPEEPPAGGFPAPLEIEELSAAAEPEAPLYKHPDPVIAQAMNANLAFSQTLPDFICDQLTEARQQRTSAEVGARRRDHRRGARAQ